MKEITSLDKYISVIMGMKKEKDALGINSYQWFFRGQKDSTWSIVPNVFRNDNLKNEYAVIQHAIRQNPFEFRSLTEFEVLTKLQHYGLGTRLLDITLNPLVALYFATEPAITFDLGKDKRYKQVERDGVVFFNYTPWHSVTELGVRIAMVIPFIELDDSFTVENLLEYFHQNSVITDAEDALLREDNYKLLVEYIQENYFIVSTHSNERLVRQSGAFVLPTAITISKGDKLKSRKIEKTYLNLNSEFEENILFISHKYKSQIREELDFFNINEATMFPELEHQMTYIQGKNKADTGSVPQFQFYVPDIFTTHADKFNDAVPDVEKVVNIIVSDAPQTLRTELTAAITQEINYIDWKRKHQIRSQIRLLVSRKLQNNYSASASKRYAIQIMDLLLNPTEEYIKNEG